jgi:hypothetical protein
MLLRVLLGVFFIAHGLVHVAIWAPRYDPRRHRSTRRIPGCLATGGASRGCWRLPLPRS